MYPFPLILVSEASHRFCRNLYSIRVTSVCAVQHCMLSVDETVRLPVKKQQS